MFRSASMRMGCSFWIVQICGKVGDLTSAPLPFSLPQTEAITTTLSPVSITSSISIRKSSKLSRQVAQRRLSPSGHETSCPRTQSTLASMSQRPTREASLWHSVSESSFAGESAPRARRPRRSRFASPIARRPPPETEEQMEIGIGLPAAVPGVDRDTCSSGPAVPSGGDSRTWLRATGSSTATTSRSSRWPLRQPLPSGSG